MEKIVIKDNFLQFTKLLEYEEKLKHCITLRPISIGNNEQYYNDKQNVIKNYEIICDYLKINKNDIYRPYQTHTANIKCVDEVAPGIFTEDMMNIDGLITNKKDKILSISIADCIDLMFFDPVKMVIGNTHSGWQGTFQLISKNTVENMVDKYRCNTKDLICCIGPSIRKCHFEVDEDIAVKFYEKFKYLYNIDDIISKGKIKENKQKYNIDTVLINKTVLLNLGLQEKNIIDCDTCTVCNSDKFHSYRVDKEASGRNTGIITLI